MSIGFVCTRLSTIHRSTRIDRGSLVNTQTSFDKRPSKPITLHSAIVTVVPVVPGRWPLCKAEITMNPRNNRTNTKNPFPVVCGTVSDLPLSSASSMIPVPVRNIHSFSAQYTGDINTPSVRAGTSVRSHWAFTGQAQWLLSGDLTVRNGSLYAFCMRSGAHAIEAPLVGHLPATRRHSPISAVCPSSGGFGLSKGRKSGAEQVTPADVAPSASAKRRPNASTATDSRCVHGLLGE
ncbi:hypothetical protein SAMN05421548_110134 [Paraburkholderia lycopersici]|uniref:Uncharacterized protein n=1 Tax=Paraburkholderia lycopersici TaxID=416944 RepID=A0A1G6PFI1_9BURK|nr:hypothetical protein SAMN05421548_110134 [Paraburkholderia lycopersici]